MTWSLSLSRDHTGTMQYQALVLSEDPSVKTGQRILTPARETGHSGSEMEAGLAKEGRTLDGGQSLMVTWNIYFFF